MKHPVQPSDTAAIAEALEKLSADPDRTALICDFDGTIAPIQDDPASSKAIPAALDALWQLAETYAAVAVVSGRPGSFLADALDIARYNNSPNSTRRGRFLLAFGQYGLERVELDGTVQIDPTRPNYDAGIATIETLAKGRLPDGVLLEIKPASATLHWRQAPASQSQARILADELATAAGMELRQGRMSIELVTPTGPDKGSIVTQLTKDCVAACVIGDDHGDISGFEALVRQTEMTQFCIAVASDEVPARLLELADIVLDGPSAVAAFLQDLAKAGR